MFFVVLTFLSRGGTKQSQCHIAIANKWPVCVNDSSPSPNPHYALDVQAVFRQKNSQKNSILLGSSANVARMMA
jgi:hypothetical protein